MQQSQETKNQYLVEFKHNVTFTASYIYNKRLK